MFTRRIGLAIASAILSLGAIGRPWGNEPAPMINSGGLVFGEHSRSRAGTRSNYRYFHSAVDVTTKEPDYIGFELDRFGLMSLTVPHFNRPKRRAERKGINTVPRAPVNSLHAISF